MKKPPLLRFSEASLFRNLTRKGFSGFFDEEEPNDNSDLFEINSLEEEFKSSEHGKDFKGRRHDSLSNLVRIPDFLEYFKKNSQELSKELVAESCFRLAMLMNSSESRSVRSLDKSREFEQFQRFVSKNIPDFNEKGKDTSSLWHFETLLASQCFIASLPWILSFKIVDWLFISPFASFLLGRVGFRFVFLEQTEDEQRPKTNQLQRVQLLGPKSSRIRLKGGLQYD